MSETARLQFLVNRDGAAAAREWALRTYRIYRCCVLDRDGRKDPGYKGHYASRAPWRPLFIASCRQLKRYALTGVMP